MYIRSRSLLLSGFGCGLVACILLFSSCGSTSSSAVGLPAPAEAQPIATVTYHSPIVAQLTPVPTEDPEPTAIPRPAPLTPPSPPTGPSPVGGIPGIGGQLILVSLSQQWLWAYQDRTLLFDTPVTTGMPELPTLDGTFSVQYHVANVMFHSPWVPSSPYYYSPEHVNYALYFAYDGYYIHDAPWREVFGPGTNYPHTDPDGASVTGSHGCVELPTPAADWLYYWAADGATIVIYGTAPVAPPATPTPTPTDQPATQTPTNPPAPTATPTNPPAPTPSPTRT
ncbi:MAG: L,D-transpeptidase [Ktedonobacterales bacterium]